MKTSDLSIKELAAFSGENRGHSEFPTNRCGRGVM
mgnify:FL=1